MLLLLHDGDFQEKFRFQKRQARVALYESMLPYAVHRQKIAVLLFPIGRQFQ
jgi:hypothetical protein